MPNPRWTVIDTREDLVPGRVSVAYRLDDGQTYTTHFSPEMEEEACEEIMDHNWLMKSQTQEAKDERIRQGKTPKLKKEHFAPGKVSKEARGGGQ